MDNKLIEQSPIGEKKLHNSGSWLWKNLKPFGCVLCLVCLAAFIFFCFNTGPEKIPGYEPAQSREFYMEHPEELAQEIKENIQSHCEHILDCYAEGDKVIVVVSEDKLTAARAVVLQYFDEGNIEFSPKN